MTENKLTVGALIKIVVLTILACMGFLVLWGITFVFSLALTFMNVTLSLILSFSISAITIFALITVLIPPRRRIRLVLSKRQMVGAYVAWAIIFVLTLPLIKINPLLFLGSLPALMYALFMIIHDTLRMRGKKEMAQK